MGTFIVGAIVLALVFLAVRSVYKDKKTGKSCCGDCSKCANCDK